MQDTDRINIISELVESFSNLSINDKRREIGRELAELTISTYKLLSDITNVNSIPNMEDFNNLYDAKISEDQYLSGLYEDLINYKELISIYFNKSLEDIYSENNL